MRYIGLIALAIMLTMAGGLKARDCFAQESSGSLLTARSQPLPVQGIVTMVDFGAHGCLPCDMMSPVLKELAEEYSGKAAIAFVDVWEDQSFAVKVGVRMIPTQIFYDAEGNEKFRHEGYMDRVTIQQVLSKLGVQ